jgi:hypothetical protein
VILSYLLPFFSEAKIPFCLVGGYAVAIHGVVRGTLDLDGLIQIKNKLRPRSRRYKSIEFNKKFRLNEEKGYWHNIRALQILIDDYLLNYIELTPQERLDWLEEYKLLIPISAFTERMNEARKPFKV